MATDPFHDVEIPLTGYPDINTVSTLVQMQTFTQVITAPSVTGTGPWEAHIFLAPYTATIQAASTTDLTPNVYNPLTQNVLAAAQMLPHVTPGYNVITGPVGSNWQADGTYGNVTGNSIRFPANASGGLFRVIGAAVEVVNTTPELYKGGSLTCYRAPSHTLPLLADVERSDVDATKNMLFESFNLPPGSQGDAQLYPSARTWAAAEGYYGIATLSSEEVPFMSASRMVPFGWKPPSNGGLLAGASQPIWTYQPYLASPSAGTTARVFPMDTHGCVVSGLNAQSTLQVTVKYMIERIPSSTEPDLLVLTRPASPFDGLAMELYARTVSSMPVGCMVKDNPLGEWFNDVLETVVEYAPKVGAAFGPLGATLGGGIATGAQMMLKDRGKNSNPQTLGQAKKKKSPPPRVVQVRKASSNAKPSAKTLRNRRRRAKNADFIMSGPAG